MKQEQTQHRFLHYGRKRLKIEAGSQQFSFDVSVFHVKFKVTTDKSLTSISHFINTVVIILHT